MYEVLDGHKVGVRLGQGCCFSICSMCYCEAWRWDWGNDWVEGEMGEGSWLYIAVVGLRWWWIGGGWDKQLTRFFNWHCQASWCHKCHLNDLEGEIHRSLGQMQQVFNHFAWDRHLEGVGDDDNTLVLLINWADHVRCRNWGKSRKWDKRKWPGKERERGVIVALLHSRLLHYYCSNIANCCSCVATTRQVW